ncbi:MAG TPA: hypothetical protein VGB55_12535, partial [Tepidisphaeraceae bacterium]
MRYATTCSALALSAALLLGLTAGSRAEEGKPVSAVTLTGKVVDAEGNAVAGATVRVLQAPAKSEKKQKNLDAEAGPEKKKMKEKAKAVAEGTTDAN